MEERKFGPVWFIPGERNGKYPYCHSLYIEGEGGGILIDASSDRERLPLGRLVTERFDSASKIDKVRAPLLQFHGTQDEIVPYRLGQKLHALAREPKEFVPIPGATHNDTYSVGGRAYFEKIRSFLSEPHSK